MARTQNSMSVSVGSGRPNIGPNYILRQSRHDLEILAEEVERIKTLLEESLTVSSQMLVPVLKSCFQRQGKLVCLTAEFYYMTLC